MALPALRDAENALILCGDTPLLDWAISGRLSAALSEHPESPLATAHFAWSPTPTGYGRILRDAKGRVVGIREQRDLTSEPRARDREFNPDVMRRASPFLRDALVAPRAQQRAGRALPDRHRRASPRKAGGARSVCRGRRARWRASTIARSSPRAEAALHGRIAERLRRGGRHDPRRARASTPASSSSRTRSSSAAVVLRGKTRIGARRARRRRLRAHRRRVVEAGARCKPYTVVTALERSAPRAQIGPFSHLRPESDIGDEAHIGNFVETKKTRLAPRREGEPPRVPRRRLHRRGRERRRRHHLLQLRRLPEAQTRASARARSSAATRSSSRR